MKGDRMQKTTTMLTVLVAVALVAMPVSATTQEEQNADYTGCIKVGIDPPGYYVDVPCLIRYVMDLVGAPEKRAELPWF